MNNILITEDLIQGQPLRIERELQKEISNQILTLNGGNYEDVCTNMRLFADVFEILEDHINEDFITLKYNPMGAWYYEEESEDL